MTCAICLDELDASPATLPCGHSFHAHCMLTAALHGHRRCPVCREPCIEGKPAEANLWQEARHQGRARRRDYIRLVQRGLRMAREGRAPPEVASAVALYHEILEVQTALSHQRQPLDRSVRAHARRCRAALAQLQREAPPDIAGRVEARVYVHTFSEERWELLHMLQETRDAIASGVDST